MERCRADHHRLINSRSHNNSDFPHFHFHFQRCLGHTSTHQRPTSLLRTISTRTHPSDHLSSPPLIYSRLPPIPLRHLMLIFLELRMLLTILTTLMDIVVNAARLGTQGWLQRLQVPPFWESHFRQPIIDGTHSAIAIAPLGRIAPRHNSARFIPFLMEKHMDPTSTSTFPIQPLRHCVESVQITWSCCLLRSYGNLLRSPLSPPCVSRMMPFLIGLLTWSTFTESTTP